MLTSVSFGGLVVVVAGTILLIVDFVTKYNNDYK